MTLTIKNESISSERSRHTAAPSPRHEDAWHVSWLPGRLMDRNSAITAMVLADAVAGDDIHAGHRLWPHIEGWASQLGLRAPDALAWASEPPGGASAGKHAVPEDPEAAGS